MTKTDSKTKKLELGFVSLQDNAEEKVKAEAREKKAAAKARIEAIKEQKELKIKEVMRKLKEMKEGASNYIKN